MSIIVSDVMDTADVQRDVPLASYTTLGIGGNAEYFASVDTLASFREIMIWARKEGLKVTVIGGGSNTLIDDTGISGLVIHLNLAEVFRAEDGGDVYITVGAGKVFDELVGETVEDGLWGLENLSAIPGCVGATPIQNVGAYGVEVSNLISSVVVYDTHSDEFQVLSNSACKFSYRCSCFKRETDRQRIVVWVVFKLSKTPTPRLGYNDLTRFFKERSAPTLQEIRSAVIEIRSKKFPDWKVIGTAGSFFKNPILSNEEFRILKEKCPTVPGFQLDEKMVKVPLGFILDKVLCLKGDRKGNVGLYRDQALVLVNHNKKATAEEVRAYANAIAKRVFDATGITIEWEVTHLQ